MILNVSVFRKGWQFPYILCNKWNILLSKGSDQFLLYFFLPFSFCRSCTHTTLIQTLSLKLLYEFKLVWSCRKAVLLWPAGRPRACVRVQRYSYISVARLPCENFPTIPKVSCVTQTNARHGHFSLTHTHSQCVKDGNRRRKEGEGAGSEVDWRSCGLSCSIYVCLWWIDDAESRLQKNDGASVSGLWLVASVGSSLLLSEDSHTELQFSQRLLTQAFSLTPPIFQHFGLVECVRLCLQSPLCQCTLIYAYFYFF